MRSALISAFSLTVVCTSCRDDEFVVPMQDTVIPSAGTGEGIGGMYLVNEGNMGSNKCTIDYLDLSAADGLVHYQRNIFAARNPSTVKELGDVGNDIQLYGSRLWIVVNCSNKVEVCTADSCRRIGQIDIPNCRFVAFDKGYAYVSSYVGPVRISGDVQLGRVYKIDTLTLQKTDSVVVGYQPEEMAVCGTSLYVANSGGYRVPNYDNTVSVVNLATMCEERKICVAPNLHRLRADRYGQLWVSSRGDYRDTPPSLSWLTPAPDGGMTVGGSLDIAVSEMDIVGDTLYYIGVDRNEKTMTQTISMGLVNVRTHDILQTDIFDADEAKAVTMPYGIKVNPYTRDFFLMDAKNYVSSGELLCFDRNGKFRWRVTTGDIPSRAAFVSHGAAIDSKPQLPAGTNPYIIAVDEYVPAPGQFVNVMPLYKPGDTQQTMVRKCTDALANDNGGLVSLGAYGGYITFHFSHPVKNVPGEYDIYIKGNAFAATPGATDGSSEPGIVMVSQDTNGNALPDDEWYELAGSADTDSVGKADYNYSITYTYAPMADTPWHDSKGTQGTIRRNGYHQQEYFPLWLADKATLSFSGTRLPDNAHDVNGDGSYWRLDAYRYGYADNAPNLSDGKPNPACCFNIDWAVDRDRQHVALSHIDFVRVYSAMNQQCGWIGETSTEISGAQDLHPER